MIELTSRAVDVEVGQTASAVPPSPVGSRPTTVHVASSVNYAVRAAASRFAQCVTSSPTMVIRGELPQSVGRVVLMRWVALRQRLQRCDLVGGFSV
jgi:hypothetical protein